jgi:hypothetical protein
VESAAHATWPNSTSARETLCEDPWGSKRVFAFKAESRRRRPGFQSVLTLSFAVRT